MAAPSKSKIAPFLKEKRKLRAADERAVRQGKKSREQVKKENSHFAAVPCRLVHREDRLL
jgi:hypothetical protein